MAEGSRTPRVRRSKAEQRAETLEQILDAAEYLFSDGATWITGQQLVVDGGYTAW